MYFGIYLLDIIFKRNYIPGIYFKITLKGERQVSVKMEQDYKKQFTKKLTTVKLREQFQCFPTTIKTDSNPLLKYTYMIIYTTNGAKKKKKCK